MSVVAALLDAWARCHPTGFTMPECQISAALPIIEEAMTPDNRPLTAEEREQLRELLLPMETTPSAFELMLKSRNGEVHFLYFWRAFGEVWSQVFGREEEELRLRELDTLRDGLLRAVEGDPPRISSINFLTVIRNTASMSEEPSFWEEGVNSAQLELPEADLSLDVVTGVLVSWLHDVAYQEPPAIVTPQAELQPGGHNLPVILHIYDVSQETTIKKINKILAHKYSPLKFGGIFHVGVEVGGLEWSYGYSTCETIPGISCVEPRQHPQHRFRQTVWQGKTSLSAEDTGILISELLEEWPGQDYELLRRNCCHFADEFCVRLGVGHIPGWIYRLARVGARVDTLLQAAHSLKSRLRGESIEEAPESWDDGIGVIGN